MDLPEALRSFKNPAQAELERLVRARADAQLASLRLETTIRRAAAAENGAPRRSSEQLVAALGISVLSRFRGATGFGYSGIELPVRIASLRTLVMAVRAGFDAAYERARYNARQAAALRRDFALATLSDGWAEVKPNRAEVPSTYRNDPRTVTARDMERLCLDASRAITRLAGEIAFNLVSAFTEFREELFVTSDGSQILQDFAFSQGDCYVVAHASRGGGHEEIYDSIGQQRGIECLSEGCNEPVAPNPSLLEFASELGKEAQMLAKAPRLRPPRREVVVVTDPHMNALLAHEIVGHPSEADRALKMEAGYAGRSWLLRSLRDQARGRRIGSPALSACSDPSLPAYGYYRYDHEGTPGRRVMHIEGGIYRDFLNSRATAALLGAEPNGSARASAAQYAPLIRMSNTFFMPGSYAPEEIIGAVEHGYYVCGSRIPSIAESRESFRISARRIYEIDHGRLGRLFRAGSLMGNSKDFFSAVDAAGNDLRLFAIPNCGKGQPMQIKRMANGGPTLRSRACLIGA